MIEAFNFERNLLRLCAKRKMDRIVMALEDGSVKVDDSLFGTVNYLIFEHAEGGDVRTHLAILGRVEVAWKLRCLHHIATGLHQLHSAQVAHQDVKPSNVLVFGGGTSKIADLGSASLQGVASPRDGARFAGDRTYAPPELLYGHHDNEWNRRRQACDLYLLGSMVTFFFAGVGTTALTLRYLPMHYHPSQWTGNYGEVIAEVRNSFGLAIQELQAAIRHERLEKEVLEVVRQLCDPDPALRGHPLNRVGIGNQYSLERYVSRFNLLARRAEIGIFDRS